MTEPVPTVFVVDDDPAIRESLSLLLDSVGLQVDCFASATEFLDAYDADRPGCLLLDIRLPVTSGLELQQQLVSMRSLLPVIFLTAHADVPLAVRAMQAGAFDFLEKPFNDQELIDRTNAALAQDGESRRELRKRCEIAGRFDALTAREKQVMQLVADGEANKIVADRLGISERTVEIHRARVMRKMRATSLPHLVHMWIHVRERALDDRGR